MFCPHLHCPFQDKYGVNAAAKVWKKSVAAKENEILLSKAYGIF